MLSIKQPQFQGEFLVKEIYPFHDRDSWRGKPGVYYFRLSDEIRYVGQATAEWGVGYRVYKALNKMGLKNQYAPNPKPEWTPMLDGDSWVGNFQFDLCDAYWPPALEDFLIRFLPGAPLINKNKYKGCWAT